MIEISRLWDFSDSNLKPDPDYLYKRPRINFRVSEYLFEFLDQEILIPFRIMQKGEYHICLSFQILDREKHKYFHDSPYNSDDSKFWPIIRNRQDKGRSYKDIFIGCNSTLIDNDMTPLQYADIVFDMYGSFLIEHFKKITRDILDRVKERLDYSYIERFPFPAGFEDQQYINDNGSIQWLHSDGSEHEKGDVMVIKNKYLEHFGY